MVLRSTNNRLKFFVTVASVLLLLPRNYFAQQAQKPDWSGFKFLIGDWIGEGNLMKNFLDKVFLVVLFAPLSALNAQTQSLSADSVTVAGVLKNQAAAFVLFDQTKGEYLRFNKSRCAERFSPKSTFKIPNSLIALETGVAPDENFVVKWDGQKRWNADWNRDHNMISALKYSVVPYYQEIARRVGRDQYKKWLEAINYGNHAIGENIDTFWLDNSLKISAEEQIEFLKRFYNYQLPFSKRNVDIVKKIMPSEEYKHSLLKFKTGGGEKEDGTWIGWVVGYVEKGKDVSFFAFNIDAKTFDEVLEKRDTMLREILVSLKVLK
ncbi:MAG: class D beta-lactamase [Bacteroidetes bacterium]|nr:class D beta-lactamase [Bacteroidota bacterium]